MGSDSASDSQDSHDDDDEEEYQESRRGNRLLGFMFGNVDNTGDLDADYLDEDAKEHLAALADKLGSSLADIALSVRSSRTSANAAEQDYDEKAEDAVDYEDIDEQYEGPEIQAATEEDLLPEKEYVSAGVPFINLQNSDSIFDDENYDEDEEPEKEPEVAVQDLESQPALSDVQAARPEGELSPVNEQAGPSPVKETSEGGFQEIEYTDDDLEETPEDINFAPLPVLCVENGSVILKFSEIFGIQEATRRRYNRDHMYLVPRERLKFIDCPDAVEEDEESFLRGFAHGSMQEDHTVQDNTLNTIHYVNKSGKIDHWQNDSIYSVKTDEEMLDDFLEAPMKEDITIDLSTLWKLPQSPNFYPLDQQDWEDSILWDSNSLVPDSPRKVQEIAVPDNFEKAADLDFGEEDHQNPVNEQLAELPMQSSLSAAMTSNLLLSNKVSHPQLLRLECQMEVDNSSQVDGSERQRHDDDDDTTRPIKDLPQNQYILEGSWLNNIIWGPDTAVTRPKFILDLQDTRMLFEVLDNKDNDKFWLHARAMVIAHSLDLSKHSLLELPGQGNQSDGRFDIANDVFYSNRKTNQQLNSGTEKRSGYGIEVYHSAAALKLETMKLKLSNKDLANFHRPKAVWFPHDNVVFKEQKKLPMLGPMKIIVKSLGGKGSKLHVDTEETISSVKAKASKKLDFKPIEAVKIFYRGKELEDLQTLSAQNVQPNSLLHVVRTKLHLLPKAQKIPSENKSLRPPGAFKKKSDLSLKDGHVFLMEYCEERPLLLSNAGMGARLCTYYQKTAPSDQNGNLLSSEIKNFGSLLVLDTTDKSPFLGDLKPGGTQSSLETNMFRAPVFPHKVSSTDYLLVRSAKGKLSLRRIDKINVVGQQEPLMEVMSPANKDLQPFLMKRVVVYMFRAFRALKKRNLTPHVLVDELASQFPNLSEVFLRNRLKKHGFADLKRGPTGQWIWKMRSNIQIPSEEFLRKLVSPEKVCAYESMQAGLYRLKHLGIMKLLNPAGLSNAMSRLPNEAIALAGASHIERELQITPWNLSSNFVACTNQVRENLERLEISGVGDPSGRGLGFSYVRATPKAPISNAVTKKKAAAAKGGTTVTGTDADLRRLSMEAAREVLIKFNVPDEVIAKQTRWHRIAMIRELSSEQAALGVKVDPTTIGKFARGQRISFVQQQQQTRERCQEIWDRQVQSLIVGGDEGASDSESNSDLDSFAGDLENLLDAEDFEDDDEAVDQTTNDRSEGAKAHKMRRHPSQVETDEKVEDEAAEAAELCRMLMDDDENDWLKKKKAGSKKEIGSSQIAQLGFASENVERIKKPKKVVKQLSSSVFFDGASIPSENAHGDKDDVEMLLKKNIPPKMPKVKILGEVKGFKEKKSARESFVCGACGQLGHMRTNKHCPRYGEEIDSLIEPNKTSGKSAPLNPSIPSHLKSAAKKPTTKKKIAPPPSDATEVDKSSSSKPKPLKLKCLTSEKNVENSNVEPCSDHVPTSSINKPSVKVSKIVISNKMKPDPPLESNNKPSIVIRPPMADTDQGFTEDPRPSIVIKPPVFAVENHAKPLIVIRPPTEVEQEQSHKRIVIKRPREIMDLDPTVHDEGGVDFGFRKVKKIVELSDLDSYGRQESLNYSEPSSKRKGRDWEHQRSWEEEEKRRRVEERKRRLQIEEQEKLMELERFEDTMREDREEEMRIKAARKKMKRPEPRVEYVDDFRAARRNGRRSAHEMTDRLSRRSRPDNELRSFVTDLGPPTKRRRGGKVGLANILEHIVETLRARQEVSYLFLKPVTKKEAPDYLKFVSRPMDLSTIREKVRKFEYKNRKQFRRDVCQITINAHIYNDQRNPGIPPLGDQLLELCDYMLYENSDSLDEVEVGIEQTD